MDSDDEKEQLFLIYEYLKTTKLAKTTALLQQEINELQKTLPLLPQRLDHNLKLITQNVEEIPKLHELAVTMIKKPIENSEKIDYDKLFATNTHKV
jgi:hypothetical protein